MKTRIPALLAALFVTAVTSTAAIAATDQAAAKPAAPASATAPQGPSEAIQRALDKRAKTVLDSLEGVGPALSADLFSAEFNKQAAPDQVQQALKQLHDTVGACKLAGRVNSPAPTATAYLLDCQKAFVPLEIEVEEKAPNRIQSLFFRGSYWRFNN